MTAKEFAALAVPGLLAGVFAQEAKRWTCRKCGHTGNSGISEMCDGCGAEDLWQGQKPKKVRKK